jgi:succinate dehydrogenase/fumarate reductase flavoprotein subunit
VATDRIKEMETKYGSFFDRNPTEPSPEALCRAELTAPFTKGSDRDRNHLVGGQVFRRDIEYVEEHRALELLWDKSRTRIVGALLLDMGTGDYVVAHARTTVVCTGGGPTMYKLFAPSLDKAADGISLLYRAGAEMVDMEMVKFHPTGFDRSGSSASGTLLEEGCAGPGPIS